MVAQSETFPLGNFEFRPRQKRPWNACATEASKVVMQDPDSRPFLLWSSLPHPALNVLL